MLNNRQQRCYFDVSTGYLSPNQEKVSIAEIIGMKVYQNKSHREEEEDNMTTLTIV